MSTYNIEKYYIFWYYTIKGGIKMLSLKINDILKERGRTPYWLGKQTGISQNNIGKICNGETSTIRFETLEKICKALNCSINDLFITDDPQMQRLLMYASEFKNISNDKNENTL